MVDAYAVIEAIGYLLGKVGEATKLQIIKLIYLADKYHLMAYGRTITNDEYYAMKDGPVGSLVLDVLGFNDIVLQEDELKYAAKLIKRIGDKAFSINESPEEFSMLSQSDRKALDMIVEKFGSQSASQLRKFTHDYPEYAKYEELFQDNVVKRKRIKTEELISTLPNNDPFNIPQEHLEQSKEILTGNFD